MSTTNLKDLLTQFGAGSGGDFEHIPPQEYELKIAKAVEKGNGVFLTLEVLTAGPYAGKKIGTNISMGANPTEKSIQAANSKLRAWGFREETWPADWKQAAAAMEGLTAVCAVTDNEYNGEMRSQVGFKVKLTSAQPVPTVAGIPNVPVAAAPAAVPAAAPVAAPAPVAAAPAPVAVAAPVAAVVEAAPAPVAAVAPVAAAPAPVAAPVAAAPAPAPAPVAAAPVAAAPVAAPAPAPAAVVDGEPGF